MNLLYKEGTGNKNCDTRGLLAVLSNKMFPRVMNFIVLLVSVLVALADARRLNAGVRAARIKEQLHANAEVIKQRATFKAHPHVDTLNVKERAHSVQMIATDAQAMKRDGQLPGTTTTRTVADKSAKYKGMIDMLKAKNKK